MTEPTWIAIAWGVCVAAMGGLMTSITPWYQALRVPSWKPPDWAFGPVWTVIIALSVWSATLGWTAAPSPATRWLMAALFVVNGALNVVWSLLFFRLKRPDWALIEVVFLFLSIIALIVVQAPNSTTAALCLVPYAVWVSIASYLNLTIIRLNGPFGRA